MDISRRKFFGASAAVIAAVGASVVLPGCGGSGSGSAASSSAATATTISAGAQEKPDVNIGIRSDMVDQYAAVEDEIRALGYNPTSTVFDDSVTPDTALGEGSIDCNWYQHEPYMKAYNKSNGTDFVMVEPKTFYPLFAMYSTKHDSVDDIPDGATFGLCNDATNQSRGLHLLAKEGLITLPDKDTPAIVDITDKYNPRGFKFIEAEMSVLPQSEDDVDAILLAAGHMVNAGKSAEGYLAQSDDNEEYAVGFAVRGEDADATWIKEIAQAVQCDDLAEYFKTEKEGTQIPLWTS